MTGLTGTVVSAVGVTPSGLAPTARSPFSPGRAARLARLEAFGLPVVGGLARALALVNRAIAFVASLALLGASGVLSYSVVVRYAFHAATYWQDEAAVFLIVGATFMSAAYVQERRGHVAIEALAEILPPVVNRIRFFVVDVVSLAFAAFFAWKSWSLCDEAWTEGQITSSTWGPPLWIPYGVMAAGMSLLALQIVLQMLAFLAGGRVVPTAPMSRAAAH